MDILQKIDALRMERGWSVNNLAMEAMLTQSTVNNLYQRKTEPKISTLRAICGAFQITLAEFFEEEEAENTGEETERKLLAKIKKLSSAEKKALLTLLSNR